MNDNLIDLFLGELVHATRGSYPVTCFGVENSGDACLRIACTGFDEDEISVSVDNDLITVSAEKKKEDREIKWQWKNIATRPFSITHRIVDRNMDMSKIESTLSNGMLEIIIPKMSKSDLDKRKIKIKMIK